MSLLWGTQIYQGVKNLLADVRGRQWHTFFSGKTEHDKVLLLCILEFFGGTDMRVGKGDQVADVLIIRVVSPSNYASVGEFDDNIQGRTYSDPRRISRLRAPTVCDGVHREGTFRHRRLIR